MNLRKLCISVLLSLNLSMPVDATTTTELDFPLEQDSKELVTDLTTNPVSEAYNTLKKQDKEQMLNEMGQGLIEIQKIKEEQIKKEKLEIAFNPNDVTNPSNLTTDKIIQLLQGTNLVGAANAYYWVEKNYGINALFLIAITAEESHWGNSLLAHNLNNICSLKDKDGNFVHYENFGECIDALAKSLKQNYLTPKGCYYNGLSVYAINKEYCPESDAPNNKWGSNVVTIANQLLSKAKN